MTAVSPCFRIYGRICNRRRVNEKGVAEVGVYLNPGNYMFQEAKRSQIYVDKTEMILYVNSVLGTNQKYLCVSRPRRFGKTMAANMLGAYYDREAEADSRSLFEDCKIAQNDPNWDVYLGKFNVIHLTMTDFIGSGCNIEKSIKILKERILEEVAESAPEVKIDTDDFTYSLEKYFRYTKARFIILIDEWDAFFREYPNDKEGQKYYLDFLRDWLKDKAHIALAYLTGILPIKKYGKHSALNMFDEYSMIHPMKLASFTGFTTAEVKELCRAYGRNFEKMKEWYDGYHVIDIVPPDPDHRRFTETGSSFPPNHFALYSPLSVVKSIYTGFIENFWNQTETFEALRQYIDWNFDGLKEEVAILMSGSRIKTDITGYQNDMTSFESKDDILTMLIHLGYLGYDTLTEEVFIPNQEVLQVFKTSTKSKEWKTSFRALENSRKRLDATWAGDEETAAALIEAAHDKANNKTYHSEAALSYAIQLAYYSAQDYYTIIPELDTGKGYADIVYLPKLPHIPAMVIELKYSESADSAISQIHQQKYPDRLEHYKGNIILVGISYDRSVTNNNPSFKHHSCQIERA